MSEDKGGKLGGTYCCDIERGVVGDDETVQERGYWRRAYEYRLDSTRWFDKKLTFLWEHALYNHLLHFVTVHEILGQVN